MNVLLGMGGPQDIVVIGRKDVRDAISEQVEIPDCRGRA
jgi:hypothetical protein